MSWINKDTLDRFWDLGDLLTTNLITSPIRLMICRDTKRNEIDWEIEGLKELPDPPQPLDDTLAFLIVKK